MFKNLFKKKKKKNVTVKPQVVTFDTVYTNRLKIIAMETEKISGNTSRLLGSLEDILRVSKVMLEQNQHILSTLQASNYTINSIYEMARDKLNNGVG